METNTYYQLQQQKLLRNLSAFSKLLFSDLSAFYGKETARLIQRDTLAEYERLIPQFPYVGGKENPLTTNLVEAGYGLALYRALLKHGGTLEQAGELICRAVERRVDRIPGLVRYWICRMYFSRRRFHAMLQRAQASQQRHYAGNWVWEVIEGDGQSFDLGMDYTECGIDKFMRSQGAQELTPYLCNTDYVLFRGLGMELVRTKTLAWGCDCCDFRIKRHGNMPPAWPPRFVERTCGRITTKE
ncbi:MAG: L-2-amino-thiazoline-4-carboxylic acid hydrolase [Anaerolineales bacterium]|nr:L-2-amino-thiazoline-4-carboxylic acid hydrolase [Anaerolineales bacterium]